MKHCFDSSILVCKRSDAVRLSVWSEECRPINRLNSISVVGLFIILTICS